MGMQSNLQKTLSGPLTAEQIPRTPLISPRLSRSVGGGMSKRKLATVAVNCLGAFSRGGSCVRGVRLEARLEVDVALPRRLGPVELGPRHVSSHGGYGARTCQGRHTPGSLRASLAGARRTPSRLGRPDPPGGARRRGWWRLPDEAAQSAGSEPFEVRVLPEGCPVAGRPGAGAVRLPRQAPKKSRHTLVRGNNDII